jgi:hypothetical protein
MPRRKARDIATSAHASASPRGAAARIVESVFAAGYVAVIALFVGCAVVLIGLAASELWHAITMPGTGRARFGAVLECVGLLTIAVVALELGQTIFEEEVQRDVKVSGPTRVRRFLSRFMVVVVIALATETLVGVFEVVDEDASKLPYVACIGLCAAALLVAWGVFIRLNRSAEELEPEAMAQAKREDAEVGGHEGA